MHAPYVLRRLALFWLAGANVALAAAPVEHSHGHSAATPPPAMVHDHAHMDHSQMPHAMVPASASAPVHDHAAMLQQAESSSAVRDPHAYAEGNGLAPRGHDDMGDQTLLAALIADRFESSTANGQTALLYDWQAWWGKTYDKLLLRAEGEISAGQFKDARNEVLWSHALSAYWDTQLGIRYDTGRGTDRGWLALGVQGLAPYWLYTEATAYVNEQGRTAFRLELEYDLLITQRLILQPRTELNFYSQADDSRALSSGLAAIELGLRLRYEIVRELAPYIGVEWASRLGSGGAQLQRAGEAAEEVRAVAGVHFWF